jgi:hypothetical protein
MNAQNPFLKNKYADLGAVIETSRPVLARYDLAVTQFPTSDGDKIGVTTCLTHSSGEWMEDTIYIPSTDSKGLSVAQSAGVVISYLRRYAWASVLGLYADEDNDGQAPAPKPEKSESERKQTAIKLYADLVARAKKVNLQIPAMDAGWTLDQMRAHYKEQVQFVKDAEEQGNE